MPAAITVAIVLVSHSKALAEAVAALARQAAGPDVRIALASGFGEDGAGFGTDATRIVAAIEALGRSTQSIVLMDLGSAVLSAETALELLDPDARKRVRLCAAPFVEGALAASVAAAGGADGETVVAEAEAAAVAKASQLGTMSVRASAPEPEPHVELQGAGRDVRIADPAGLHLRPAAEISRIARAEGAKVTLSLVDGTRTADGRQLTALLGLGARRGTRVHVQASGANAARALERIERVLASAPAETHAADAPAASRSGGVVGAAPGIGIGPAFVLESEMPELPPREMADAAAARAALDTALTAVRSEPDDAQPILAAQREFLEDPALLGRARELIATEHLDAAPAWARAVREAMRPIQALDEPVLRARARDLSDVGVRVLRALGEPLAAISPLPDAPCVVVADDLSPSEASRFDPRYVLGVIDRAGGTTSHAAIVLRAKGIPGVVNASDLGDIATGVTLALDGTSGRVWIDPDATTKARLHAQGGVAHVLGAGRGSVTLASGAVVELWANVANRAEAEAARQADARGIGLLRTEFAFMDRAVAPSEEEQAEELGAIVAPMHGRPVLIRTLDAGADKPLPFLRLEGEGNPFLGVRGIRATLAHPELFSLQLRAILRAGVDVALGVMLPMVTDPEEVIATRGLLERAHTELVRIGTRHAWPVQLGIMVEVPAVALGIERFAEVCDFYSIGTNDLTQYTLAADRNNARLARFHDAGHPAVIALCRRVVERGSRPVSVCGEAAGDPRIAPRLVAAGIRKLSMAPPLFASIRTTLETP